MREGRAPRLQKVPRGVCVYLRLLECLSMHPGMICRHV